MKIFIVNINDCLSFSQYEPFFYEHIYKGDLILLDEISDTCELDKTYNQILSHINRHPFSFKEGVVFLFIPRDFSKPLSPQDYELYNNINIYMNLVRNMRGSFRFFTFYVDKTDKLESNDATYIQLKKVSHSMKSDSVELDRYFLSLPEIPENPGDFKAFIRERISCLKPDMGSFYEYMLQFASDVKESNKIEFSNLVKGYIGEARSRLAVIEEITQPVFCDDISDDIRAKIKIIYYIKSLITKKVTIDKIPKYSDFVFEDFDRVKRLIATYLRRLKLWYYEHSSISQKAVCTRRAFRMSTSAAADYKEEIDDIITKELRTIKVNKVSRIDLVDSVFDKLNIIISRAHDALEVFVTKESKELFNPINYYDIGEYEFSLDEDVSLEDKREEADVLEHMNNYSPFSLPGYSEENRLEQELEAINTKINCILERLNVYKKRAFLGAFLFSVISVAALYFGTQYSVFLKENTWWVFGLYMVVAAMGFSTAYITVRKRYLKDIEFLLLECKDKVERFLGSFQTVAEEFEANLIVAGEYSCLKDFLEQKRAARDSYQETKRKHTWHMMKVNQIITNFSFFDGFIKNALPYDENPVTMSSYDHDPEHTEFYQMKVF